MKQKGFTLIELLVVIAIIGLISSIVLVSMGGVRAKARDAKRKADIAQIARAIELFYNATESYPKEGCNPDSSNGCSHTDDWWTGNGLAGDHLGRNISEFIKLPVDPKNDSTYYYHYEPHCQVGSTKQGFWIKYRLEEDGGWHYIRNGIQDTDPECATKCDSCW